MLPPLISEAIITTSVIGCSLKTLSFPVQTLQARCQLISLLFNTCLGKEAELVRLLGVMAQRKLFNFDGEIITVD